MSNYTVGGGNSDLPPEGRRHAGPLRPDLVDLCLGHLSHPHIVIHYEACLQSVEHMRFSAADVTTILLDKDVLGHRNYEWAGIFLSAAYNHCYDDTILFDIEAPPMHNLAMHCAKTFVNMTRQSMGFGIQSSGIIVNAGTVDFGSGSSATGIIINTGSIARPVRHNGLFIDAPKKDVVGISYVSEDEYSCLLPELPEEAQDLAQRLLEYAIKRPQDIVKEIGTAQQIIERYRDLGGFP